MPNQGVPVTGAVLRWARQEAGLDSSEVASRVGAAPELLERWESGEDQPSQGQFTRLVNVLRRPSAIFFLPEPPRGAGAGPLALRGVPGLDGHRLSDEETRAIRRAQRLQQVVGWVLRDAGTIAADLPVSSTDEPPGKAADRLRGALAIDVGTQLGWASETIALQAWRRAVEDLGVLSLQGSLGKGGIRGFSAWDARAPLVVVSSSYSLAARIFTLVHELGHIILRGRAACFGFSWYMRHSVPEERWCERFAAEVLMPRDAVLVESDRLGIRQSGEPDPSSAAKLAQCFRVSVRAAAIRLQEVGLAPIGLYQAVDEELGSQDYPHGGGGGKGQVASRRRLGEVGGRVPSVLFDAVDRGRLPLVDLADCLRLTVGQLEDLRGILGAAI